MPPETLEPTRDLVELAIEIIASVSREVVCECKWCETGLSVYCTQLEVSEGAAPLTRRRRA